MSGESGLERDAVKLGCGSAEHFNIGSLGGLSRSASSARSVGSQEPLRDPAPASPWREPIATTTSDAAHFEENSFDPTPTKEPLPTSASPSSPDLSTVASVLPPSWRQTSVHANANPEPSGQHDPADVSKSCYHFAHVSEYSEKRTSTRQVVHQEEQEKSPRLEPVDNSYADASLRFDDSRELIEEGVSFAQLTKIQSYCGRLDETAAFGESLASDVVRQHFQWAQEWESVDQKQADLALLQWKLVRNQTGMLTQQLADARKQIDLLLKQQHITLEKVETQTRESQSFEDRMKSLIRQLSDRVDASVTHLRQDIDAQVQKREAGEVDIHRRFDSITKEMVQLTQRNGQSLEQEVRRLRTDLQVHQDHYPLMKEQMERAVEEMKIGWDQMLHHHRQLKEYGEREARERKQNYDEINARLSGVIENERNERELHQSKLFEHFDRLQADIGVHRDEFPSLRNKLQHLEDRCMDACQSRMEQARLADVLQKWAETERRVEHLQKSITQESAARQSLAEVFEQMLKTERTKMTNLIRHQVEITRRDCEEASSSLHEKVEKEKAERQSHMELVHQLIARHKAKVQEDFIALESQCQSVETKCQSLMKEVRELEAQFWKKLEDDFVSTLRVAIRDLQCAMSQEQSARQDAVSSLEAQLEFIGSNYDKLRDVFVNHGPRKMAMMTPPSCRALIACSSTPAAVSTASTSTPRASQTGSVTNSPASGQLS